MVAARLIDRVGKGIRGAPRDALVADIAPPEIRGAAFGLRQSLDTVGAFLGPLLAMGLMLLWANDFRAVFWVAVIPAVLSVALLLFGVQEPERKTQGPRVNPIRRENLRRLPGAYWWVVAIGAMFTLARFSEAFLVLRAAEGGLPLALTPLVLIAMNLVYAASAYPLGRLADSMSHARLLAAGLLVLIAAADGAATSVRAGPSAPGPTPASETRPPRSAPPAGRPDRPRWGSEAAGACRQRSWPRSRAGPPCGRRRPDLPPDPATVPGCRPGPSGWKAVRTGSVPGRP
ncbi:MFS transporter [Brevundimonas sp.]|uniref:MFS transporter n=1 Tax=Brevundimonas sp. TaxID=1871086 RepID=UPI003A0FFD04